MELLKSIWDSIAPFLGAFAFLYLFAIITIFVLAIGFIIYVFKDIKDTKGRHKK